MTSRRHLAKDSKNIIDAEVIDERDNKEEQEREANLPPPSTDYHAWKAGRPSEWQPPKRRNMTWQDALKLYRGELMLLPALLALLGTGMLLSRAFSSLVLSLFSVLIMGLKYKISPCRALLPIFCLKDDFSVISRREAEDRGRDVNDAERDGQND